MSKISINNLSFHYEGSFDDVFSGVSFSMDSSWKLGFIARNGRGKTTLLNLLSGKYPYTGSIDSPLSFSCFPFDVQNMQDTSLQVIREAIAPFAQLEQTIEQTQSDPNRLDEYAEALDEYMRFDGYIIDSLIEAEIGKLDVEQEVLQRPFCTLSHGERTKLMLAALFLRHNSFLLIDEPTNHLDFEGRKTLTRYLGGKQGFILVSHDRALLDAVIDHVLTIDKDGSIRVEQGNYSSWQFNKDRQDAYEIDQNEKLKRQITTLSQTAREKAQWSDKIEGSKIGSHSYDRGFIGHQAAKMMKRSKAIEGRVQSAIEEKSKLLKNIEEADDLKLFPQQHPAKYLVVAEDLSIDYGAGPLFSPLSFSLMQGERLCLKGRNGSGKSSIIKLLLGEDIPHAGKVQLASNLVISYVNQDTSHLGGSPIEYAVKNGIDQSLFLTILRKLGFERIQFEKNIDEYSQGQKKKVLLAASLCQRAHLYIWDEPLNYIDLLSRVQIENLLLRFAPTMVFIEHDQVFAQRIASKTIELSPN